MPAPKPHARQRPVSDAITVRLKDSVLKLTFAQAFSYGHTLLRNDHIDSAAVLFEHLAQLRPKDRQVNIMLARCKARLADYQVCKQILDVLFEGELEPVAEHLHTAFVYRAVGLFAEARKELLSVVESYPDVPSACLALGDLFEKVGRPDKAEQLWKLAAARDKAGGSIAHSAKSQLALLRIAAAAKQKEKTETPTEAASARGPSGAKRPRR